MITLVRIENGLSLVRPSTGSAQMSKWEKVQSTFRVGQGRSAQRLIGRIRHQDSWVFASEKVLLKKICNQSTVDFSTRCPERDEQHVLRAGRTRPETGLDIR